MAYNTLNPVGSKDPRDLYDNATNFDNYANGPDPWYPNRFGVLKLSIEGQQQAFNSAQAGRSAQFEAVLSSIGFSPIGDYGAGVTFTTRQQYTVRAGLAYTVANSTTLPFTLTGTWATDEPKLKLINSDQILRSDLATDAPGKGVDQVSGAFRHVATVTALKARAGRSDGEVVYLDGYRSTSSDGDGPIRWDASSTETADDGYVFAVAGVTTGRWIRVLRHRLVLNASDYGVIGDANYRDAVANQFYKDAAKTQACTDETVAMTKLFTAACSGPEALGKKVIDLNMKNIAVSTAMAVTRSYVAVNNGRICQLTEAQDVIRFQAAAIMMYNTMDGASFSHAYSTIGAGSLVHILEQGVGQFRWTCFNNINEGGFNGWKQYGGCFMMDLDFVWINDTYSSGFYMPGGGGTTQPPVQLGGSTTTVMHRPYVTNVRTKDPAFDIGTGYDGITMVSPAADHITQFGRFKVNGLKIEGILYSENIRKPIEGAALVDHKFIEIQNASGFTIDGAYASLASDFGTSPTGIKTFLDADFIVGEIGMVRGGFPADYSFIRTQGGEVEYTNMLPGLTLNTELSGGRAVGKFRSNLKFSGTHNGTGSAEIFTIPGMAAESEAHTYLVTKTYSFAGTYVSNTWMVSAGNGKSVVTQLQAGPDQPTAFTLTVASTGVVTLTNTGGNILSGPWTAVEFNAF